MIQLSYLKSLFIRITVKLEAIQNSERVDLSPRSSHTHSHTHTHLWAFRETACPNLHICGLSEKTRKPRGTCKLHIERPRSGIRIKPRTFMLWGDSANHWAFTEEIIQQNKPLSACLWSVLVWQPSSSSICCCQVRQCKITNLLTENIRNILFPEFS